MTEVINRRIFLASACFLLVVFAFGYGYAVQRFQVWPYEVLKAVEGVYDSLRETGTISPKKRLVKAAPDAVREQFFIHDPDSMIQGYYAFMGWNQLNERYLIRLYDSNGKHLHTWTLDYYALDSDGPLNGSDSPHALKVLPDGSIIVGYDKGDIMARLDSCSQPIWVKSGIYHHSLEQAEDGSFWVWHAEGTGYGHYNYIQNFDPETGETISEIGLIEDIIIPMSSQAAMFGIRADYEFTHFEKTPPANNDIFHPNDVDILHSSQAHMFPDFNAGDLLLSFRSLHLVAVLDPVSKRIKWWSHGPWRFQHDPDFTDDGKISVYSNNTGYGRSEILKIDPRTREITNDLYDGNLVFYTFYMGKHQYLPNGNVLVTVPEEGRVIEVTGHGDKVMEFNNLAEGLEDFNGHLQNGIWLSDSFFTAMPECREQ